MLTKDRAFYRQFFSLLVFVALQNLVSYCVSLADNVMLSNYSQQALAGVSLANQVQFLLQMIVGSVGEGVVVLAAQYWGRKNTKPIISVTAIGIYVGLAVCAMFMIATFLAPRGIMRLLTEEEPLISAGADYLGVIRWSYPAFCLSTVMLASMRSVENVRIGFVVTLSSLLINLALNYLLIFGHFGFPEMGVTGAAIATLVARVFELVVAAYYMFGMDRKLRVRPAQLLWLDRALLRDYAKYATPVILAGASWGVAMFVQSAILGRMGEAAVAANASAASLFSVISVFAYGSGNASGVITGKIVGAGDMRKLREYVRTMQILFLMTGLVTGGAVLCLRDAIVNLFYPGGTGEAARIARQFMTVLSVTVIGSAYQAPCLSGIVRGGGHTKFVFYNDLVFQWGVVMILSFLAQFVWHLAPVWVFLCLKSDQILKCIVAAFEVNSYRWIRKLTHE